MRTLVLLLGLLTLMACQSTQQLGTTPPTTEALYRQAIQEAAYPAPAKVYDQLVAINENNDQLVWKTIKGKKYLLVVTWKKEKDAARYENDPTTGVYNTTEYPIWITTAPQLLKRMKEEQADNPSKRLTQLLGLPPTAEGTYTHFVEFWVQPQDLFRPCPDAEITDATCNLCFPTGTTDAHINWINDLRASSYYGCELYDQYPWTQLGYTYDWNPKNSRHVGLSEFVIGKNKDIIVKEIYPTAKYLAKEE